MLMKRGEHWRCINPFCGGSVTLRISYYSREDPPRCACGSPMRNKAQSPSFDYLEFLHPEESGLPAEPGKKE
jgi:hypothetical protein